MDYMVNELIQVTFITTTTNNLETSLCEGFIIQFFLSYWLLLSCCNWMQSEKKPADTNQGLKEQFI